MSGVTEQVISFLVHRWVNSQVLNYEAKFRFEFLWVKEDKKRRRSKEKGIKKKCQVRKSKENVNNVWKRQFSGKKAGGTKIAEKYRV